MGCGASAKPEFVVKLDSVESGCRSADVHKSDECLSSLQKGASDLNDVMDTLVERGSKDNEELQRVQYLSDVILNKLETMVDGLIAKDDDTTAGLSSDDLKAARTKKSAKTLDTQAKILEVGVLLDKVRATKASTILKDKISSMQDKAAQQSMVQVAQAVARVQQPTQLADGLGKTLDLMEETHHIAPESKKITDNLLKCMGQLSATTLKFLPQVIAQDPAALPKVVEKAKELDSLAVKLVVIMESKWDPPLAPNVEAQVNTAAKQVYDTQIGGAEASLKATGEGGVAFGALKEVKPWWPLLKDLDGCSTRVAAVFELVEKSADKAFQDAKGRGDTATCEAIKGFAGELDKLRGSYDGCAAPDGAGLSAKLSSADAVGDAIALLVALESAASKAGALDTAPVLSSLEGLISKWADASKADAGLAARFAAVCASVEKQTLQAAAGSEAENLQKFATEYDLLRPQITPPEVSDGPLCPRLIAHFCEAPLKEAEEELAKTEHLNPAVILEALQRLACIDGRPEDVAVRIDRVLTSCQERVATKAEAVLEESEAVAADRLTRLLRFAGTFDAAAAKLRGAEATEAAGSTLTQHLELLKSKLPAPAEDAAPDGDPPADGDATAEAPAAAAEGDGAPLAEGEATAEAPPADGAGDAPAEGDAAAEAPPAEAAADAPAAGGEEGAPADGAGDEAGAAAAAAGAAAAGAAAVSEAPAGDAPEPSEEEKAAASEQLGAVEGKLSKESGMNPHQLLEALQKLVPLWGPVAGLQEFQDRILAVYDQLSERMSDSCRKAAAADSEQKLKLLLDFASKFHAEQEGLGSPKPGFLRGIALAGADTDMTDAEVELAKESGMKTMAVLNSLQNLRMCWSELGEVDDSVQELRDRFSKVCGIIHTRMNDAFDKAAGDPKKQGALVKFAGDFDAACSGLDGVSELGLQKELQDKLDGAGA